MTTSEAENLSCDTFELECAALTPSSCSYLSADYPPNLLTESIQKEENVFPNSAESFIVCESEVEDEQNENFGLENRKIINSIDDWLDDSHMCYLSNLLNEYFAEDILIFQPYLKFCACLPELDDKDKRKKRIFIIPFLYDFWGLGVWLWVSVGVCKMFDKIKIYHNQKRFITY